MPARRIGAHEHAGSGHIFDLAQPMKRAIFSSILLCILVGLSLAVFQHLEKLLAHFAFVSGWVLFALMIILAGYNVWKKLPFLPLGSSEGWLQFHIYAGLFSVSTYLIHTRFRWPTGLFEQTLALFYASVTATGLVG